MRLGITNDHRGYKLKVELLEKLKKNAKYIDEFKSPFLLITTSTP